jgi:hypothetical protein
VKGKTLMAGPQSHGLGTWKPLYRTGGKITQQHSITGEMREVDALGDPEATPQPIVAPAVPAGPIEKNAAQQGFLDLLNNIETNYKPEYVGPVQARARDVAQKYDLPKIGLGASEGAANFVRDIADLRSAIVNERTGAAVGERQEWDRLLQLIPDDYKSDKDFLPKIKSIRERYQKILANRQAGFKAAGYRAPSSSANKSASNSGLTPEEQAELDQLEAEFGGHL